MRYRWLVPVACSAIAPFILFFCVFFIRESISHTSSSPLLLEMRITKANSVR